MMKLIKLGRLVVMGRWRGMRNCIMKELEAERGTYLKRQQQDDRLQMKVCHCRKQLMTPDNDSKEIMGEHV